MTLTKDDIELINQAKRAGADALGDVQAFAHTLILHVAKDVSDALPAVTQDIADHFYAFIPAASRGFIQGIVGGFASGAMTKLEDYAKAQALAIAGMALNRIDAAIAAVSVKLTPTPTTPPPASSTK